MAQFQYTPATDKYDLILNGASLLGLIASKQVAITAASPLLLDSVGNLSIDLSAYETVAAATLSLSLKQVKLNVQPPLSLLNKWDSKHWSERLRYEHKPRNHADILCYEHKPHKHTDILYYERKRFKPTRRWIFDLY